MSVEPRISLKLVKKMGFLSLRDGHSVLISSLLGLSVPFTAPMISIFTKFVAVSESAGLPCRAGRILQTDLIKDATGTTTILCLNVPLSRLV